LRSQTSTATRSAVVPFSSAYIDKPQPLSLADRIEQIDHALTAKELAVMLHVSPITIYQLAQAGRIDSFRVGTAVRFDPVKVAKWLRTQ
jgi:excisionase family DNA binding protein